MKVRQAVPEDMEAVLALYDGIIDRFQAQTGTSAWQKGVYPTEADFSRAIGAGTLYLGEAEGILVGGMILTQGTDRTYGNPPWRIDAPDCETAVIHTLGISPNTGRRGLGLELVEGAVEVARSKGWKALRLDVLEANLPARRFYERAGFVWIAAREIWYESTGTATFHLYERAL